MSGPTSAGRVNCLSEALCDSAADRLPPGCGAVVALRGTGGAISGPAAPEVASLVPDRVGQDWRDRLGRALAPLRDAEPDRTAGAIPREVHLSDLVRSRGGDPFDATEVLTTWERGPTTAVTVGIDPTGPATLDLRTAGPHALVGGTTGSGKSELLQSWIVALARANRPEDVAFVLVDYKGGAAFGECARLPHTVGMLTDLDPHLAHRALRSLDAELRRRERLLAADLVDHLNLRRRQVNVGGDKVQPRHARVDDGRMHRDLAIQHDIVDRVLDLVGGLAAQLPALAQVPDLAHARLRVDLVGDRPAGRRGHLLGHR